MVGQVLADEQATSGGEAGTTRWLFNDEQQSVRTIATSDGSSTSVVDQIVYDSFGNVQSETFSGGSFTHQHGYTGQVFDTETGLGYFKARYYDPHSGRFLSEDPQRDGENWIDYVGNNPINATDPTGMFAQNSYVNTISALGLGRITIQSLWRLAWVVKARSYAGPAEDRSTTRQADSHSLRRCRRQVPCGANPFGGARLVRRIDRVHP
jgi:RHS repeat-associated protein